MNKNSVEVSYNKVNNWWSVLDEHKPYWGCFNGVQGFTIGFSENPNDEGMRYRPITMDFVIIPTNRYKVFICGVCKNETLPIKMSSWKSCTKDMVEEINNCIKRFLGVPKDLLMDEILENENTFENWARILHMKDRFKVWDTAIPQQWLDDFTSFVEKVMKSERLSYYFILVTTVWAYGGEACPSGEPFSICHEVNNAIKIFHNR
jgi:hypothetical protein